MKPTVIATIGTGADLLSSTDRAAQDIALELQNRLSPFAIPDVHYRWLTQSIARAIEAQSPEVHVAEEEATFPELTPRETQVLKLLMLGYSNKEIARSLGMLNNTVRVHVSSILKKCSASNRTQAAAVGNRMWPPPRS